MTALNQIKERMAYYKDLCRRKPRSVTQSIVTRMEYDGVPSLVELDTTLITCKDCKHEHEEWGYPYCCRIPTKSFETDGDNFCGFAERREA